MSKKYILRKKTSNEIPARLQHAAMLKDFNRLSQWFDNQSEPIIFTILEHQPRMKYLSSKLI